MLDGVGGARRGNYQASDPIFTIGHSSRTLADFTALVQPVGVTLVVDIRAFPRSRAAPQFNTDTLPNALAAQGIRYRHMPVLGGRRHRRKDAPPSRNTYWRVAAFQNYADYAATADFRAGLNALLQLARDDRCAIMCAEAVWWRCHRRIVTDYLLAGGTPVDHIMGQGVVVPATLTPGARLDSDGTLWYPALESAAPQSRD
ncbi:MAG TPA: DUF488 domain-containing protein [Gemmatimonadaceae bacterium]|nr:DUF488 domain-containing protein [Gemmatimonadaceae bacterium]